MAVPDGLGGHKHVELLLTLPQEPGRTQAELAEILGETQSAVSKVESGQRRLDLAELSTYTRTRGSRHRLVTDEGDALDLYTDPTAMQLKLMKLFGIKPSKYGR